MILLLIFAFGVGVLAGVILMGVVAQHNYEDGWLDGFDYCSKEILLKDDETSNEENS